jgi:hypothetical protein
MARIRRLIEFKRMLAVVTLQFGCCLYFAKVIGCGGDCGSGKAGASTPGFQDHGVAAGWWQTLVFMIQAVHFSNKTDTKI